MSLKNYWHEHTHSFPIGKLSVAVVLVYVCIKIVDLVAVELSTYLLLKGL